VNRAAVAVLPLAALVTLAALLTLSGCVAGTNTSDNSPLPSTSATDTPRLTDGPNTEPPEDDATVVPVPEAAGTSQEAAIAAAENAVAAFGRPDLPYQEWINGLYPLMTQTGAAAYEGTDPQNVPVHQVTGAGSILDGSTEVALIVQVPTDAGTYNVSLSRASADAPWLADRIRPAGA
jgi:hypothetical protein